MAVPPDPRLAPYLGGDPAPLPPSEDWVPLWDTLASEAIRRADLGLLDWLLRREALASDAQAAELEAHIAQREGVRLLECAGAAPCGAVFDAVCAFAAPRLPPQALYWGLGSALCAAVSGGCAEHVVRAIERLAGDDPAPLYTRGVGAAVLAGRVAWVEALLRRGGRLRPHLDGVFFLEPGGALGVLYCGTPFCRLAAKARSAAGAADALRELLGLLEAMAGAPPPGLPALPRPALEACLENAAAAGHVEAVDRLAARLGAGPEAAEKALVALCRYVPDPSPSWFARYSLPPGGGPPDAAPGFLPGLEAAVVRFAARCVGRRAALQDAARGCVRSGSARLLRRLHGAAALHGCSPWAAGQPLPPLLQPANFADVEWLAGAFPDPPDEVSGWLAVQRRRRAAVQAAAPSLPGNISSKEGGSPAAFLAACRAGDLGALADNFGAVAGDPPAVLEGVAAACVAGQDAAFAWLLARESLLHTAPALYGLGLSSVQRHLFPALCRGRSRTLTSRFLAELGFDADTAALDALKHGRIDVLVAVLACGAHVDSEDVVELVLGGHHPYTPERMRAALSALISEAAVLFGPAEEDGSDDEGDEDFSGYACFGLFAARSGRPPGPGFLPGIAAVVGLLGTWRLFCVLGAFFAQLRRTDPDGLDGALREPGLSAVGFALDALRSWLRPPPAAERPPPAGAAVAAAAADAAAAGFLQQPALSAIMDVDLPVPGVDGPGFAETFAPAFEHVRGVGAALGRAIQLQGVADRACRWDVALGRASPAILAFYSAVAEQLPGFEADVQMRTRWEHADSALRRAWIGTVVRAQLGRAARAAAQAAAQAAARAASSAGMLLRNEARAASSAGMLLRSETRGAKRSRR